MHYIEKKIIEHILSFFLDRYSRALPKETVLINDTRKEFDGDITIVVFPFVKWTKKSPEQTGQLLGEYLSSHLSEIMTYNVVKGFLNVEISDSYWVSYFKSIQKVKGYAFALPKSTGRKVAIEYCGPNTNKPLHLGHIRNMLIGYATCNLMEAVGDEVVRLNIYNDRGIAICKSMIAWQKMGKGATPTSSGVKGDHFVGKYYVKYDELYKQQIRELGAQGVDMEKAKQQAPIFLEAQRMLRKWEQGDSEILDLWKRMNAWVYEGFQYTFDKIGVVFDKVYYESEVYMLGKKMVESGLEKGVYYQKEDSSVWVDLREDGLDEKILLRSDGTSVYLTQDFGVLEQRYEDFKMDRSIYVVADEQNYHFKVLKLSLEKLNKPYAKGIKHLSYGLVELPQGRMKTREGTVVDADYLIDEMIQKAEKQTISLGKIDELTASQAKELFETIGIGALKYFILKVNPKKKMLFNPEESIHLNGDTAPFIQYTYARIYSMVEKSRDMDEVPFSGYALHSSEKALILFLYKIPKIIQEAAETLDVSLVAGAAYQLAKMFNKLYAEVPIIKAKTSQEKYFRVCLARVIARTIKELFDILGIKVPHKM